MGKIVLLDELTINKIAAGEVIERPASVVKELMENSIDAGATKITVEVKNGGINEIRIIDNGCGIAKDDLEYAFEKHATSKIRKADDLEQVTSMGFRGEALASVAAISKLKMISKTKDSTSGNKIIIEAGKILKQEETAAQDGTTIIINNLFFNTPVRYKFLKKDFTELGYIEDAVTRIALANPNIAIKLTNEGKTIIQTTGNGDLKTVIYNIYGKDIAEGLLEVNYEYEEIKITGVVGKPEIARGNRNYQMFFVNKRYIKDKTLYSGIEQAFKGLLPIGKFGFAILNITIEPHQIDVNVHPAKLEIRFSEEQKVFKAVYHSLKDTLLKGDLIKSASQEQIKIESNVPSDTIKLNTVEPNEDVKKSSFFGIFNKKKDYEEDEKQDFINKVQENTIEDIYIKKNDLAPDILTQIKENTMEQPKTEEIEDNKKLEEKLKIEDNQELNKTEFKQEGKEDFEDKYRKIFGVNNTGKIQETENISMFENANDTVVVPNYKYIGTIFKTYIVIEINNEAYIIDQHAAHERVLYEKVKKNFYSDVNKDSQIMLLPDIIQLSHKEKTIVKENTEIFKKAGFVFEEFGDNTIRLIGVPNVCIDLDTKQLFKEILDAIDTVAITAIKEKEEKFISTVACKAAVKANMQLNKEEVDSLMKKLLELRNPFTCPHGRPTAIKMTKAEIEKKFNRT